MGITGHLIMINLKAIGGCTPNSTGEVFYPGNKPRDSTRMLRDCPVVAPCRTRSKHGGNTEQTRRSIGFWGGFQVHLAAPHKKLIAS